ncbi:predicted protein [Thalassiosira pseudonana CCMP1335]|uniref:Uncharacterized protein n=1 Tax=Thalassiosira pseudonana TaxID=35128 RepID=B8C7M2_THAPS|nr:predicted protein [Thalassiosira pseudonana CCMP1335]EED90766.1 predicted protein [Thalassiosira pseudonana CCMP1335]
MTSCTLKMQPNDGCFVLRSDGTFTFAIVIGKDWGEGHIDLLVDMFGSAKRVSLKHWSNSIRAVPLIDNGNEKGTSSTVADTSQANDDTTNEPSEEIHHSKRSEQSSIHQTDSLKTILVETISFRKKGVHPSKPESILRRSKSDPVPVSRKAKAKTGTSSKASLHKGKSGRVTSSEKADGNVDVVKCLFEHVMTARAA